MNAQNQMTRLKAIEEASIALKNIAQAGPTATWDFNESTLTTYLAVSEVLFAMAQEAEAADADPKAKAKLATEALDGLHIETMLAISTAHVSESTMEHLEADDLPEVNVKPFGEEGVVVYLTPDEETWNEIRESYVAQTMPEDLWLAMCWAREHGCVWLLLDADAEEADGLTTYDL